MASSAHRAELCIWTDILPESETDFNRWYDREHMQERVGIPGFQFARRFQAIGACPRPYLALYCTESIDVFSSELYRQAFANQTEWSLRNFARMKETQRRVGELAIESGEGEGAYLSLFILPENKINSQQLAMSHLNRVVLEDGIVSATLLHTVPQLSASLTAKDASLPPADGVVMLEGTRQSTVQEVAQTVASAYGVAADAVYPFHLLWRLGA